VKKLETPMTAVITEVSIDVTEEAGSIGLHQRPRAVAARFPRDFRSGWPKASAYFSLGSEQFLS
jgi:hypothetical protein